MPQAKEEKAEAKTEKVATEELSVEEQQVKDAEENEDIAPPDYIPGEGLGPNTMSEASAEG